MIALPYEELPVADPGTPDTRSPGRYMLWVARQQLGTICLAMFFGTTWMVAMALVSFAIGTAVDKALIDHSAHELVIWCLIVMGLGLIQAISGVYRHQMAVTNWMKATYRSIQAVGHHLSQEGTSVIDEVQAGDVVNTVAADAMRIGGAYDVLARFVGAIASWIVVGVILMSTSVELGLVALVGVPLLGSLTIPLTRPLHATQAAQREAAGRLAALGADTVAGLRILRGVGGEDVFLANYKDQSQLVRFAGNKVAPPQAGLESGQVLLPGILTTIVVFLGAHQIENGTLQPGQLVAFFGLSMFLTTPLRTSIEWIVSTTRAYVGARKVIRILNTSSTLEDPADPEPWPERVSCYRDELSGLEVRAGQLAALVTETPDESSLLADRLGRFSPEAASVTLDGTPLTRFSRADTRRHIVVSEVEPRLFSGDLRTELSPHDHLTDDELLGALETVSALDVLDSLDEGLDSPIEERGRNFSGGQRQRLSLARALLAETDLLVLVEPTSAVDTHTEGRIAHGLRQVRSHRATLIATTSPLMLEQADVVNLVVDGEVAARGTHAELLTSSADYRRVVLRGVDE